MEDTHKRVRRIAENGLIAALYYGLTMLFVFVPVLSQFGPIQCRFSEMIVLFAFFRPDFTIGITVGCFLANLTGFLAGQGFAFDLLFGTGATLIACLLEAYASHFLFIGALWHILLNGVIVGTEIYFFFNNGGLNLFACMGYVALGEAIALGIGYAVFMGLIRNQGFTKVLAPTRHAEVKF